jgi:hypothetical protein
MTGVDTSYKHPTRRPLSTIVEILDKTPRKQAAISRTPAAATPTSGDAARQSAAHRGQTRRGRAPGRANAAGATYMDGARLAPLAPQSEPRSPTIHDDQAHVAAFLACSIRGQQPRERLDVAVA